MYSTLPTKPYLQLSSIARIIQHRLNESPTKIESLPTPEQLTQQVALLDYQYLNITLLDLSLNPVYQNPMNTLPFLNWHALHFNEAEIVMEHLVDHYSLSLSNLYPYQELSAIRSLTYNSFNDA